MARTAHAGGLVLSADDGRGAATRSVVRFHLRAFAREVPGARAGDVEAVHQLRVATRRLRAALRLFKPILPATTTEAARQDLAWLGRGIGGVRDLDVLALAVGARSRRLEASLRAGLAPLGPAIRGRRASAQAELLRVLDANRTRSLLARLAALGDETSRVRREPPLGEIATELLQPHLRAVVAAGRRVGADASPEALHRLRVRVKRLRYALETLRGLGGKRVERLLRRLAALQELLGEHQDAVMQITWLRTYAEEASAGAATQLAIGALIQVLGRRAAKLRRQFPKAWRRVDHGRFRRRLLEDGGHVQPAPRTARVVRLVRVA